MTGDDKDIFRMPRNEPDQHEHSNAGLGRIALMVLFWVAVFAAWEWIGSN